MKNHPLYSDPSLVELTTKMLMAQGKTTLQIYQYGESEAEHAKILLDALNLPENAKVLSLGCGVGGMEAHWKKLRPDLQFTLVNNSREQLNLCLCEGERVCQDLQEFEAYPEYNCVILAYVLGHVDPKQALAVANRCLLPGGMLLINDLFEGSEAFNESFFYDSPSFEIIDEFAAKSFYLFYPIPVERLSIIPDFPLPVEAFPGVFILQKS